MRRVEDLTLKLLDGPLTEEESGELLRLIESDGENAAVYLGLMEVEAGLRGTLEDLDLAGAAMESVRRALAERIEDGVMDTLRSEAAAVEPRMYWSSRGLRRHEETRRRRRIVRISAGILAAAAAMLAAVYYFGAESGGPPRPEALVLEVAQAQGGVETSSGAAWVEAKPGTILGPGDGVWVGEEGYASLRCADSTAIELGAGADLRVERTDGALRIGLWSGSIEAIVAARAAGAPFVVLTPHAEMAVVGTHFLVSVAKGQTRLEVIDGRVRLTDRRTGGAIEVAAGYGASVCGGGDIIIAEALSAPSIPSPAGEWERRRYIAATSWAARASGAARRALLARHGGGRQTEETALAALRWLARHQEPDGHWDSAKYGAVDPSMAPSKVDAGVTGLALLAFLGAGYTHVDKSEFQDTVKRSIGWIKNLTVKLNAKAGMPGSVRDPDDIYYSRMYAQGICTMAIAEAYGMTNDPALRKLAQDMVDYVAAAQAPYFGWRYDPSKGQDIGGDMPMTGWQVMALKSAKIAGLTVDPRAFEGAMKFVEADTIDEYGREVGYMLTSTKDKPAMGAGGWDNTCAVAALIRLYLGQPPTDKPVRGAGDHISERLFTSETFNTAAPFYYAYYSTLVMFQLGGDYWARWNEAMKKALISNQRTAADGENNGSWDPYPKGFAGGGSHVVELLGAMRGGRVMSTAMGAMMLEVYYRYPPLYR